MNFLYALRDQRTPLLLITGGLDQQLPPSTHVAPMQQLLPANARVVDIADAQHFSFLPLCGEGAVDLLAESNEQFVCQEFGGRTREEIHAQTLNHISEFLEAQGAW